MWTSVVALAIALNFEPTRYVLTPILLSRRNPVVQLLACHLGAVTVNLISGLLILFVFRNNPLSNNPSAGGKVQMAVGGIALIIALIMLLRRAFTRGRDTTGQPADEDPDKTRAIDKILVGAHAILRKGGSPWFAALLGMGLGLPSVDFLAVLVIIGTSNTPPMEQVAALVTFILIGGIFVLIPLIGYAIAPERTLQMIERFAAWTRSRSQLEYAALLGIAGAILIGVGYARL